MAIPETKSVHPMPRLFRMAFRNHMMKELNCVSRNCVYIVQYIIYTGLVAKPYSFVFGMWNVPNDSDTATPNRWYIVEMLA